MSQAVVWMVGAMAVGVLVYVWWRKYTVWRKLPPGSMGWPVLGETWKMYKQNPNVFFASKQRRYGEISKTHILGSPAVMITSPEAAKMVLVTQAHLFKPTFPLSKQLLIGRKAVFFQHGDDHVNIRNILQSHFNLDTIRNSVTDIETLALQALDSIDGRPISVFSEMKSFTFDVGCLFVLGTDQKSERKVLKDTYLRLEKGYNSYPFRFPGTEFCKSLKAREQLRRIFSSIIARRREEKVACTDLLGMFIEKNAELSEEQIIDNIVGIIFASQDTTASVITWLVKYLAINPALLASVTAEHEKIREAKILTGECGLTFLDTRNMVFTSRVLQETMRMASILSFTFREAVEDFEYKGYVIPKGWKVLPMFRSIHHNPDFFPDPLKFDPTRFEVSPKPNTFLPFGTGIHSCIGSELAKVEIFAMIHHLVTKFRMELLEPSSGVDYRPFLVPKDGLRLKISRTVL